jgi:ribosomal-protein-alanine N-acetyltransferase
VLPDGYRIETLRLDHAAALADAYRRNADFLGPYEPRRSGEFFTLAGQESAVAGQLAGAARGSSAHWVVVRDDEVVGRVNLNSVVRGAFQSASVGYWVDQEHLRRGLATAMVEHAVAAARQMGLHRVEAGTLLDNTASQTVLLRCGFAEYGRAPSYLCIDGAWRDHVLFQRLLHDTPQ